MVQHLHGCFRLAGVWLVLPLCVAVAFEVILIHEMAFRFVCARVTNVRVTIVQLAGTQEGREICAGLKRAAQVLQSLFSPAKLKHFVAGAAASCSCYGRPPWHCAAGASAPSPACSSIFSLLLSTPFSSQRCPHSHPLTRPSSSLQLMERAKMPAQGRPARSIDLVHL